MSLAPNQFQIGDQVWTVAEDELGDLRATSGGSEVLATMPADGSIPEQVAKLLGKMGIWFYSSGMAAGKNSVYAEWQKSLNEREALAKEALAS